MGIFSTVFKKKKIAQLGASDIVSCLCGLIIEFPFQFIRMFI